MDIVHAAVIAIRPEPRRIAGHVDSETLAPFLRWVRMNEAALIDHWNEEIDTAELISPLHRV